MEKGGLQLLPDTRKKIQIKTPGANSALYTGLLLLVAVFVFFIILRTYSENLYSQITKLNTSITALESQRDKEAEQNLLNLSQQTTLMSKLFGDHIYWSQALQKFGELLQSQVQVKSLKASSPGEILSFTAVGDNFSTVARQIASFTNNDALKDVAIGLIKANPLGLVEFSADLHLDGKKFFKH